MRGAFLLAVVLVLGVGRSAAAQTLAQARVGASEGAMPAWHVPDQAAGPESPDVNALLALQVAQGQRSWARRGAVLGAVAGALATYLVTHHGGSTSLCDRSANQDAMGQRECVAVTVAGGLAGAGLGYWIGGRVRR